jgi:membrane dipeptidase
VLGIPLQPCFVKRDPDTHKVLPSTVEDVLNQIDYAVNLMGVDHVGIGTDMSTYAARTLEIPRDSSLRLFRPLFPHVFGVGPTDRYDPYPVGLDSHAKFLNLTRGLVKRGYSDEDTKKILGGNWLRLFKEVWRR